MSTIDEQENTDTIEDEEIEALVLEQPDSDEIEEESPEQRPAVVINIHSWATPIVGVVMLVLGLLGGFFARPFIPFANQSEEPIAEIAPTAIAQAGESEASSASAQTNNQMSDADRQEMMAFLIGQTKHFKGDPEAPVTIIEFSDFQ